MRQNQELEEMKMKKLREEDRKKQERIDKDLNRKKVNLGKKEKEIQTII